LPTTQDARGKFRFRSRNELLYSLRSIYQFAPFVNHIYIVTFSQKPKWLKPHPKITIVDHKEIFKESSDLPTFNSQAIEANLHHIPNLSECYIYFNDDVFLGARVRATDFFCKNGQSKVFVAKWRTANGPLEEGDLGFECSWKNTNSFLDKMFGSEKRKALQHAPFAFRKAQMKNLEQCLKPIFRDVSSHKFRSPHDHVVTCGLSQYFLLHQKMARRSKISNMIVTLHNDLEITKEKLLQIKKNAPCTFCIQDAVTVESPEIDQLLEQFFKGYFPDSAPWEIKGM
jgi:hypothetical protein